jgi:bacillolysin
MMSQLWVTKRSGVLLFLGIALVWLLGALPAAGQEGATNEALATALAQTGARISVHAQTGQVRFIGADPGRPISQTALLPPSASRQDAARGLLATYGSLFGLADPSQELILKNEKAADQGRAFVRFQQVYNGIPVLGGEMIVQLDGSNNLLSANGEILPDISLPTTPTIPAAAAVQSALNLVLQEYGVADLTVSQPELWIFNPILLSPDRGPTRLVWRMDVTAADHPIRELVLIDALRGTVALHFSQIDTARNRLTYTANNGTLLPGTLVCNEANPTCAGGDAHAVAAHRNAGYAYDFYWNALGRDSIDNAGMTLISTVHYGVNFDNAFWNSSQMVYGDARSFAMADDVVGHELTHGVTERESNLFYYYQSGAINESLSDVFGEFVDLTNGAGNDSAGVRWQMGEEVAPGGALRNMKDPTLLGDPDKMTSPNYYLGAGDGGGVHTNSSVNNKAAYLMTDGDTFNGQTVASLGITKVARIYYEVQTHLLTSGSDYADLYDALYQGCLNLVGTAGITAGDCQQARNAANAVEMNQQPVSNFNTDAPLCPAGSTFVSSLFFDNLESGTANWTFGALTGANRWQYDSPYGAFAHSGSHFLYADDYPAAVTDSYAAMNASVALPASAYLHFAHAYGFQGPNIDGGVLEYSTNNGAAWNSAASLLDFNGYDGTLAASNNPLAGQSAFLDDSHGYISSRVNLASLAGQSVRFRWRMGLNSTTYDWGWWVDDVRIYNCTTPPPLPEIAVEAPGSVNIADGGSYNMGSTLIGTPLNRAITVRNPGTANLTLAAAAPTTTGNFTAGSFGSTTIGPGGSTTFNLTCSATTGGSPVTGTVSFGNNDSDENPFNFNVSCTVGAPPPNDNFANASPIPGLAYSDTQSTVYATLQTGEQKSTCVSADDHSVWYRYTATSSHAITFSTFGSDHDTVLSVWTGNALGSLAQVVCNDDYAGLTSQVTVNASPSTTYHIRVSGYGAASGTLRLNVPPANDNFANASIVPIVGYRDALSAAASLRENLEQSSTCDFNPNHTVWYRYTTTSGGAVTFTTVGSDYDTVLSVWTGNAPGSLTEVACNDDYTGLTSQVTLNAAPSTTYSIRISDYNSGAVMSTSHLIFQLASPPDAAPQAGYTTHTPILTWNRLSWATSYEIQIADNPAFAGATNHPGIAGLSFTTPSLANGVHYWRVRGTAGTWSAAQIIVIAVP